MRRGEVWTAAGGKDYAGKPRPVVIVQSDAPLARPVIEPNETNGLNATCRLMADKITTMPRAKLGNCVGRLADEDILRMNRAILVFLGLAG